MFVERVLSLTDSSDLKKVSLDTEVTDFARVEGWICAVVRRNVVELDLFLYADNEKEYTFVLPRSVFGCKTLKGHFVFLFLMVFLLHSVFQISSPSMSQMLFLVYLISKFMNVLF